MLGYLVTQSFVRPLRVPRHRPVWNGICPPKRNFRNNSGALHRDARFKILFMGRDEFSCLVFRELYAARDVWDRIVIATNPDEKTGRRGSQLSISPLKLLGESLKVPVQLIPHTRPEFKHWTLPEPFAVKDAPPQGHIVITASFGRILSSAMLDNFAPNRRLNVHPSLLPAYRGPAPIQHAILNDEKETGVSVIEMLKLKEGIDAGAIWGTSRVPLHEHAMFPDLRDTLGYVGGRLLVSVLRAMRTGMATSQPQVFEESAPHAPLITAVEACVNFSTMSAESIVRRYRAISHQRPLITCLSSEKTVQLHAPSVFNASPVLLSHAPGSATFQKSTRTLVVRCSDGSILSVPLIRQQDKSLMEAKDWWNGAKGLGLVKDNELKFLDKFDHLL